MSGSRPTPVCEDRQGRPEGIAAWAGLKAWHEWLELKRLELASGRAEATMPPATGGRIELADLKERVRKLEAIAAGIDL